MPPSIEDNCIVNSLAMKKSRMFGRGALVLGTALILVALYLVTICYPEPLFPYLVRDHNLLLYSTGPLPADTAMLVKEVQARLAASAAYNDTLQQRVFICGTAEEFAFFANFAVKSSGLTYVYLNHNIFLRPSDIGHNQLTNYSGYRVMDDRTLVYYISHEVTHSLTVSYIGASGYHNLPKWIREGYADYIGKGHVPFHTLQREFEDCSYPTNREYLRYQLMTAYLLDIRRINLRDLLERNHALNERTAQSYVDALSKPLACPSAESFGVAR
jgi:hypothetical protein